MNEKYKFRLLWGVILGLLLLNLAILGWMWSSSGRPPLQGGGGSALDILHRELGFSEAQKKQLEAITEQHFQKVKPVRDSVRLLKDMFFDRLSDSTITDTDLNALSEKVAHKMAVADQMVFRHFQEIRAICTPKQQVKFDEIIKDALHQQGRGQMRNGPLNGRRAGPPPPQ